MARISHRYAEVSDLEGAVLGEGHSNPPHLNRSWTSPSGSRQMLNQGANTSPYHSPLTGSVSGVRRIRGRKKA
jgi:hypothetical protein